VGRTALLAAALLSLTAPAGPHFVARDPVPILMYHVIATPPRGAPYPGLYVEPTTFRAQMKWLATEGYEAVTLRRVYDHWMHGRPLPPRPVVLSFDDGYPSQVDVALPVLRAHGWAGVLNFQVGNLIPARVRQLVRAGWEIDSHTFRHPDLTTLGAKALRREVAGSRTWIRGVFHVPASFFAYPSGRYDSTVIAAVRRAGYLGATTTDQGYESPADGMWQLRRIRVDGSDGVTLAARLAH
jgi:peptidoglycan/xylan/chitin deacetylase (PgdA/CDA1 family)